MTGESFYNNHGPLQSDWGVTLQWESICIVTPVINVIGDWAPRLGTVRLVPLPAVLPSSDDTSLIRQGNQCQGTVWTKRSYMLSSHTLRLCGPKLKSSRPTRECTAVAPFTNVE